MLLKFRKRGHDMLKDCTFASFDRSVNITSTRVSKYLQHLPLKDTFFKYESNIFFS